MEHVQLSGPGLDPIGVIGAVHAAAPIEAVVFDAVGTLLHPTPGVAAIYQSAGRSFGLDLAVDVLKGRLSQAMRGEDDWDRNQGWKTDEARKRRRWFRVVGQVFHELSDERRGALFAALWERFAQPEVWRVPVETADVLRLLIDRRTPWFVASNFDARLLRLTQAMPEFAGCSGVFISSQVGWRKPSAEFFQAVAQSIGRPVRRMLFVGDDPANDEAPAAALGWQTLRIEGADSIARLRETALPG